MTTRLHVDDKPLGRLFTTLLVTAHCALIASCGSSADSNEAAPRRESSAAANPVAAPAPASARASAPAAAAAAASTPVAAATAARAEAQAKAAPKAATLAPLFDDAGRPLLSPASAVPANPSERTRNGLYATRAQFEWQELMLQTYCVLLDVDALGSVDAAVQLAQQVRALQQLPGLTYFVRSGRRAEGAEVVNRLADQGFAPVFLIL
ncbi:MAG TPA: hypothetical protein VLJ62_11330 [Burkholderiaceae bacterium]|nr:hypothetical protein [Burkholderiaceae bacterium]